MQITLMCSTICCLLPELPAEAQAQLKAAGSLKAERDPPEMSGRRNIGFSQRPT